MMSYGRKPFELQMRKNQYKMHLRKLQEISKSNNYLHRNISKERQEIDAMIKNSHQLHSQSLKIELKRREKTEVQTLRTNYKTVKSTLKHELNRKILPVPERHKADNFLLDIANLKMVDKILNAKSQFSFRSSACDKLARLSVRKRQRLNTNEDFSQLYKNSMIKEQKKPKIILRLDRSKQNCKIKINFLDSQTFLHFKGNCQYFILLETEQKRKKSKTYTLQEILMSQLAFEIPKQNLVVSFIEKLGEKNLLRFKIAIKEEELNRKSSIRLTKPIEDPKDRAIGIVEIEIAHKVLANPIEIEKTIGAIQDKQRTCEATEMQSINTKE